MTSRSVGSWMTISVIALFIVAVIGLRIWFLRFETARVLVNGQELSVLVAKTPTQWYRGLGKREGLVEHDGMLFLFGSPDRHGIVMRDMRFAIDIVWIHYGEIVDIAPSVHPEPENAERQLTAYFPRAQANAVLELPAGKAAALGIGIGDRIEVVDE